MNFLPYLCDKRHKNKLGKLHYYLKFKQMLVTFKIRHATTKPGESAFIVGNTDEFGNWIVSTIFCNFIKIQDSNGIRAIPYFLYVLLI